MLSAADILIVDDDADIRDALSLALELEGYAVQVAQHGGEAWDLLCAGPLPALVLLDLAMPIMNGQELLARMRAEPRLREVPVVIVTAFGAAVNELCGRAQGCLRKPLDLRDVLDVARRFHGRAVA